MVLSLKVCEIRKRNSDSDSRTSFQARFQECMEAYMREKKANVKLVIHKCRLADFCLFVFAARGGFDCAPTKLQTSVCPSQHIENQCARCTCAFQTSRKPCLSSPRTSFLQGLEPVVDALLPDVLKFPPGTQLHDDVLVKNASIILQVENAFVFMWIVCSQGYGSCMASHALAPCKGWLVIDACAAPGNKTTHLSALMNKSGKIVAFDLHQTRLSKLQENVRLTGATNVKCQKVNPGRTKLHLMLFVCRKIS